MRYGRVIGNIVSTIKNRNLKDIKLAIVEPIDIEGNAIGNTIIVGDYLGAAVGNHIMWIADGKTISERMGVDNIPLRGSFLGIIDSIDMESGKKVIKD